MEDEKPTAGEQQVEDLEVRERDADDVRGGAGWGVQQAGSSAKADGSVRPGGFPGGIEQQHNETLVRV